LEITSLDLAVEVASFLLVSEFDGFDCGLRNIEGTAQSEISQPRAWD